MGLRKITLSILLVVLLINIGGFLILNQNKAEESESQNTASDIVKEQTYSYPMLSAVGFLEGNEIYGELIEIYQQAIEEQWSADKLLEEDIYPFDGYASERRLPETLGYEFRDINQDGTLEMIVGDYLEDESPEIYDIYKMIDGELEKVFTNGIRTKVTIYEDGTVSDTYSNQYLGYYHLKSNGEKNVIDGFKLNNSGEFVNLVDEDELMSEAAKKDLVSQYNNIKITKHTFNPFVTKTQTKEEQTKNKQAKKKQTKLTDDAMKNIMYDTYHSLEDILLEDSIEDIFNEHHKIKEAQEIYESGIDPNSPLYEDLYDLLYPKVKHLVAKEGMESFINIKFAMYWNPVGNITFYSPGYHLEVVNQRNNQFVLKQTKELPTQDVEVTSKSTYDIYHVRFIKEKDDWKFAGAIKKN